jgi:hypothetical protein
MVGSFEGFLEFENIGRGLFLSSLGIAKVVVGAYMSYIRLMEGPRSTQVILGGRSLLAGRS